MRIWNFYDRAYVPKKATLSEAGTPLEPPAGLRLILSFPHRPSKTVKPVKARLFIIDGFPFFHFIYFPFLGPILDFVKPGLSLAQRRCTLLWTFSQPWALPSPFPCSVRASLKPFFTIIRSHYNLLILFSASRFRFPIWDFTSRHSRCFRTPAL